MARDPLAYESAGPRFVWRTLWRKARSGLGVLVYDYGGYGPLAARSFGERHRRDETERPYRKIAALARRMRREAARG